MRDDSPKQMTKVLVVDVGGTHVKLLATGQDLPRRVDSGPTMTAEQMVNQVAQFAGRHVNGSRTQCSACLLDTVRPSYGASRIFRT